MGLGDVIDQRRDREASTPSASGAPWISELEILALHGFLHALGHDHETDKGEMEALEKQASFEVSDQARGEDAGARDGTCGHDEEARRMTLAGILASFFFRF